MMDRFLKPHLTRMMLVHSEGLVRFFGEDLNFSILGSPDVRVNILEDKIFIKMYVRYSSSHWWHNTSENRVILYGIFYVKDKIYPSSSGVFSRRWQNVAKSCY
jgi:hypothetical protein